MIRDGSAIVVAILAVGLNAAWLNAARAQGVQGTQGGDLPCDAFAKNADGFWYALRNADIRGTGGPLVIRQGSVLRPGAAIKGLDLATMLDEQCPATAAPPPPAVAAPPGTAAPMPQQAPAQPQATLSRYADANGSIDVQRLTCGEIADSPPQEAEFFLSWYSGWYNGSAKKRGINIARVRYAIRSVVDYCRANPDKRLVQVMELMLK
jgi:HdeA/HdeB family